MTYALDRETGTLFVPVGNPGPDYNKGMRPGANLFTISTVALDARTGKLKWWYQLRANDDHDWDATVVSLFDTGGKKLVATAGKEGILHVVNRDDGKLVFKLPMTTTLNHDVPLTPEGVRVCPVAGVQWNGAAYSPLTGLLYVNAIDWCTVFKLGPEPEMGGDRAVHRARQRLGHQRSDRASGAAGSTRSIRRPARWRGASSRRRRCTRRSRPPPATCCSPGISTAISWRWMRATGKSSISFNTGGPIAGGVVTYEQNGKQYVAVASGSSGGSIPLTGSTDHRHLRAVGRVRFASSTSSTASFKLCLTSSKVSPCVLAPGSSSTKPIYPSGTFWKTAVSFMIDLEHGHDGSIPAATTVDASA